MKKKIQNYLLFNKKTIYCFIYITFYKNYCIIEIPFKPIQVNGIPKYKNITFKEPLINSDNITFFNSTFFTSEGGTTLNKNILFLGTIQIGSNNQQFNLVLNTGSYILWVPKLGSTYIHKITDHYDPSASNTSIYANQSFKQTYGTAYCEGYYYKDNIVYIDNKTINMKFWSS